MRKTVLALCAVLLLGMSSCGSRAPEVSDGRTNEEQIQDYLQERYQTDFRVLNTLRSADGRTPFSYHLLANCVPVSDPDCLFITEASSDGKRLKSFTDLYAQGVMNKKAAAEMQDTLSKSFEICNVRTDVRSAADIPPADLQSMTVESYFKSIDPDYAAHPDRFSQVTFYAAVSLEGNMPETYEDEFDALYQAIADFSEETKLNTQITVYLMPGSSYQIYLDWYAEHRNPMGTVDDFKQEVYRIAYDVQQHAPGNPVFADTPTTKEDYVTERTQHHNETEGKEINGK